MSALWYLKRAQSMGLSEVLRRAQEQVKLTKLLSTHLRSQRGLHLVESPRDYSFFEAKEAVLRPLHWDESAIQKDVSHLIKNKTYIYSYEWQWNADGTCWHRAPDTSVVWPTDFFWLIDHRPGNRHGDARVIWELNRLQHFVVLAYLCSHSNHEIAERAQVSLLNQLGSWLDSNPPYAGIAYSSAMECALRIIAVLYAVDLSRNTLQLEYALKSKLLHFVHSHCLLIENRLSLDTSAGNHTIAECVGLLFGGKLFPELEESERWVELALPLLESETLRQIHPDGGSLEQAPNYLKFILDLCTLAEPFTTAASEEYKDRLSKGHEFISLAYEANGALANIGDSDSGHALSKYLLPQVPQRAQEGIQTFQDSGYTFIKKDTSSLIMDHGPLGMPPLFGHGHSDALSILLSVGTQRFLIDPGTYSYSNSEWRHVFRGNSFHNTVIINNQDVAHQNGPFLWSSGFSAQLLHSSNENDRYSLLATHNGYQDLGITHYRGLQFEVGKALIVIDWILGKGIHTAQTNWIFGTPITKNSPNRWVTHSDPKLNVRFLGQRSVKLDSVWSSKLYHSKEPVPALRVTCQSELPIQIVSIFEFGDVQLEDRSIERLASELREKIQ